MKTIDGRKVEVEIAENCHQDEPTTSNELRMESTIGTEFMDLNDDCLRKILFRVTAMDLCSLLELSEVTENVRLKAITNETFARKYKSNLELNEATTTVDDVERLLNKFGSLVSSLGTDGGSNATRQIKSIIKCCSGTLKTLNLRNYLVGRNETKSMKALFGNLESLRIENCDFEGDAATLFASCRSLNILHVCKDVSDIEAIIRPTFPHLERFFYGSTIYKLQCFFTRHKRLKWIALLNEQDQSYILPIFASTCSELERLLISTNGDRNPTRYKTSVKSISALKNLKRLFIRFDPNAIEFIRELHSLPSLRQLELWNVRCRTGILTALTQLKMLEMLGIYYCEEFTNFQPLAELCRLKELRISSREIVTFDLVYMVSRLSDLEMVVLDLKDVFMIDEKMHSQIVDARTKSGSTKRKFQVTYDGITTHFCNINSSKTIMAIQKLTVQQVNDALTLEPQLSGIQNDRHNEVNEKKIESASKGDEFHDEQ